MVLAKSHRRAPANKPKPNTRFLRNIIKETDSHNAALLAKEAAESRARLRNLVTKDTHSGADIRRRQLGQITAHLTSRPTKRQRSDEDDRSEDHKRRRNTSSPEREPSRALRNPTKHRERRHRDHEDVGESRGHHSSHHRSHKRHRSRSTERPGLLNENSRSRSRSPDERRSRRSGHGHRSSDRHPAGISSRREPGDDDSRNKRSHSHRKSRSFIDDGIEKEREETKATAADSKSSKVDDDSDPLDDIIGPRPPPIPKIRSRGRGTISTASGIDFRFSTGYDPTTDVELDPAEEDDWDQALEAFRDRQKWKQQGADRLRAAGFTEEEVEKWEKGGEKKEADVKWAKKGESREWDRGKVFGANSGDELAPKEADLGFGRLTKNLDIEFGRLKRT